jgi:hypothetical protein
MALGWHRVSAFPIRVRSLIACQIASEKLMKGNGDRTA